MVVYRASGRVIRELYIGSIDKRLDGSLQCMRHYSARWYYGPSLWVNLMVTRVPPRPWWGPLGKSIVPWEVLRGTLAVRTEELLLYWE